MALVAFVMLNVGPLTRVQLYVKASTAGELVSALPLADRLIDAPALAVTVALAAARPSVEAFATAVGADTCSTFTLTEAAAFTWPLLTSSSNVTVESVAPIGAVKLGFAVAAPLITTVGPEVWVQA